VQKTGANYMEKRYFDLEKPDIWPNYRWIQPPQIAYFVTTIDNAGNLNVTPVTLGTCIGASLPAEGHPGEYYFSFSLGHTSQIAEGNTVETRHGYYNLQQIPECVISFIPAKLLRQSTLTGLPIPRGISEIDVAGLTPLPSRKVRPAGIAECPINLEAKVFQKIRLGRFYTHYLCKIVAVNVDEELLSKDKAGLGSFEIDPLFEVNIQRNKNGQLRLYYGRMDRDYIQRTDENVGCLKDWIGRFGQWMRDEQTRGNITESDRLEILELNRRWQANRDPINNGSVKRELTERLRRIVAD